MAAPVVTLNVPPQWALQRFELKPRQEQRS